MITPKAELVFFAKWLRAPFRVASVTPSGARLARAMAASLPAREGQVIELGGGTGPVTEALLASGVAPKDLVVIERDPHFHLMLSKRFPEIAVVLGDAREMQSLVGALRPGEPVRAIVSGLPMVPVGAAAQIRILQQAMALTDGLGPFIQFSYGLASPIRASVKAELGLVSHCVAHVWRNVPPARVWLYTPAVTVEA
jgi:phosphatidylethanolamine/phosphatidyl-N-methylethanolamine N-methyltransferase